MDYLHNNDLVIRPFVPGDRPLVEDFFARLGEEGSFFFNRNRGNERMTLSWFDGALKNIVFFMAELNGKMLGYVFLYDLDVKTPWLGIAVSEDAKGQHLGTRLMAHAEAYARQHHKGAILLTTHMKNVRGQALYEKSGYTRIGVHTTGELLYIHYFNEETV